MIIGGGQEYNIMVYHLCLRTVSKLHSPFYTYTESNCSWKTLTRFGSRIALEIWYTMIMNTSDHTFISFFLDVLVNPDF